MSPLVGLADEDEYKSTKKESSVAVTPEKHVSTRISLPKVLQAIEVIHFVHICMRLSPWHPCSRCTFSERNLAKASSFQPTYSKKSLSFITSFLPFTLLLYELKNLRISLMFAFFSIESTATLWIDHSSLAIGFWLDRRINWWIIRNNLTTFLKCMKKLHGGQRMCRIIWRTDLHSVHIRYLI